MADRRDKGKRKMPQQWGARRRRSKSRAAYPVIIISSSDSDVNEVVVISSSDDSDEQEGFPDERPTPSAKPTVAKKEAKQEIKLPPGAKLLIDCEASDILQGLEERIESLKNLSITMPKTFPKSVESSKESTVHYTNANAVKRALDSLKEYGATDWEIIMIVNSCPESCEEAYALIPSLKDKEDRIGDHLNVVLATLAKFRVDD